ncbi:MAG: XdhC family protein [Anaerolineaceae bacterium]
MSEAILKLGEVIQNKETAVLATVIEVKGASPIKGGAQILLLSDGKTIGNVGGGRLEAEILNAALHSIETSMPGLHHFNLTKKGKDAIGTLCGGEVTVFVQPYFPPPQLVIVGGGHIGRPLQIMGKEAGFEVVVVDVKAGQNQVPELDQVSLTRDCYIVLITTDHVSDEAAMRFALKTPVPYIGMIGSLAKCKVVLEHINSEGFSKKDLARVFAPIGLDLGGNSPQEIAVAILAEVIACRQKKGIKEGFVKTRRIG